MKEIQSSIAKARFAELLDDVESGETIVITRHGKPIAHILPVDDRQRLQAKQALQDIKAMRQQAGRVSTEEILTWRDEGRR